MTVFRRTLDALLPILIGIVIGFLSGFAVFSGRISALETTVASDGRRMNKLEDHFDLIQTSLTSIQRELSTLSSRKGAL